MAYGKFKMGRGSGRVTVDPREKGGFIPKEPGKGDGRVYAGGPGWRELNNLGPVTPGKKKPGRPGINPPGKKPGRPGINPPGKKPGNLIGLPPIRRKGPGGGPKPRKPIVSREARQLPGRIKPQGQRRKASDMGKTARNGRSTIYRVGR